MKKILTLCSSLLIFGTAFGQANANRVYNFFATQRPQTRPVGNYRSITIDHTKVPNTDQTNFPVLFSGTYTYLKTVANGGLVQNASGYDITFSLDSLGNSPIAWEFESWDPVTGVCVFWLKLPTVSHTTDQVFYLHYNNPSISSFQGSVAGSVWDNNYLGVWHMNQTITGAGQTVVDVSANALNATTNGTWTSGQQAAGKVGGSLQLLNANADYLNFSSTTLSGAYTVEGWYNVTTLDNTSLGPGSPAVATFGNNINWFNAQARLFNGAGSDIVVDATTTTASTWTHIAFTRSGTTALAYHNGAQTASSSAGAATTYQYLGRQASSNTADIKYDELRFSSIVRSGDWITTEYNNMNSPSTFYTVGSQF